MGVKESLAVPKTAYFFANSLVRCFSLSFFFFQLISTNAKLTLMFSLHPVSVCFAENSSEKQSAHWTYESYLFGCLYYIKLSFMRWCLSCILPYFILFGPLRRFCWWKLFQCSSSENWNYKIKCWILHLIWIFVKQKLHCSCQTERSDERDRWTKAFRPHRSCFRHGDSILLWIHKTYFTPH